jgi:hypothetical protein
MEGVRRRCHEEVCSKGKVGWRITKQLKGGEGRHGDNTSGCGRLRHHVARQGRGVVERRVVVCTGPGAERGSAAMGGEGGGGNGWVWATKGPRLAMARHLVKNTKRRLPLT